MICVYCKKPLGPSAKKYCSISCQQQHKNAQYLQRWLDGEEDGFRDSRRCALSKVIRNYVLDRAGHKCEECGWNKKHALTGISPLDVHHVDGDSQNNRPENLKVLCPNCHALTTTYRNLNRGNGRKMRMNINS